MRVDNLEKEICVVKEPQLEFLYYQDVKSRKKNDTLNVLSLFSGCGGMDLGFEGGFSVLQESVNEILSPNFINKKLKNGFVEEYRTSEIIMLKKEL